MQCNQKLNHKLKTIYTMKKFLLTAFTVFFCFLLLNCVKVKKSSSSPTQNTEVKESVEPQKEEVVEGWKYRTTTDEMTDKVAYFATIDATNTIQQDFPYGETFSGITVRKSPRFGLDVMVMVSDGQIFGNEYYGDNYLEVRFDSLKVKKYYYTESSSLDSKTVFINDTNDFIAKAKKAKDIKISVPLYDEGRVIFRYHTDKPLKWD